MSNKKKRKRDTTDLDHMEYDWCFLMNAVEVLRLDGSLSEELASDLTNKLATFKAYALGWEEGE